MTMLRRLRTWALWGLMLASIPAMGRGDEIRLVHLVSVREEYNDNLYFDPSDWVSDFITVLSPGLKLDTNTERLKTGISARIDHRLYGDNTELNATDQFYGCRVSYAFTPGLRLGANADYSQTSSPDRTEREIYMMNDRLRTLREKESYLQSQLASMPTESDSQDKTLLKELKARLVQLESRCSDMFPDVIKTRAEIASLEERLGYPSAKSPDKPDNPAYVTLAS